MVNNDIRKRRLTKRESLIYDEPVSYTHLDVYKRQTYNRLFHVF